MENKTVWCTAMGGAKRSVHVYLSQSIIIKCAQLLSTADVKLQTKYYYESGCLRIERIGPYVFPRNWIPIVRVA